MIGPDSAPVSADSSGGSLDGLLLLVLRSPEGGVARRLKLCADGKVIEALADDPISLDSSKTVEILAPVESLLSVGELLHRGDVRILKGASLLREHARLLRQAVTDSEA
jgi:hypothetical protein